jgi:hypothetical protein
LCWDGRKLKFESTLNVKAGAASNDGMMFKPLYLKIHRTGPNVWRKERYPDTIILLDCSLLQYMYISCSI